MFVTYSTGAERALVWAGVLILAFLANGLGQLNLPIKKRIS